MWERELATKVKFFDHDGCLCSKSSIHDINILKKADVSALGTSHTAGQVHSYIILILSCRSIIERNVLQIQY